MVKHAPKQGSDRAGHGRSEPEGVSVRVGFVGESYLPVLTRSPSSTILAAASVREGNPTMTVFCTIR